MKVLIVMVLFFLYVIMFDGGDGVFFLLMLVM